ncbi:MAG: hypothetical protein Q7R96_06070 [Nanoarchaeota archaeon]|nr:hypothetical protein [Nanoarchaeota archaeon]
MDIKTYRQVNCAWFRTPELDFSSIEKQVDEALINCFKSGYTPEQALSQVLRHEEVSNALHEQAARALNFQEITLTRHVEQQTEAIAAEITAEAEEKTQAIAATYRPLITQQTAEAEEKETTAITTAENYSKTQQELDALRKRIEKHVEALGGEQGVKNLLSINRAITEEKPVTYTPPKEEKETTEKKQPKEKTLETLLDTAPAIQRRPGFFKRVFYYITFRRPPT